MNRSTMKDVQGNWALKGVRWEDLHEGKVITGELRERLYGALWRLMEYEDTGLEPDEVEEANNFSQSQLGKTLKKLAEEREKTRWIPVGERLPENDDMMLVTCQTKAGRRSVNRAWYGEGFWHGSGSMSGVIAWRPLPKPYMEEKEGN